METSDNPPLLPVLFVKDDDKFAGDDVKLSCTIEESVEMLFGAMDAFNRAVTIFVSVL